MFKSEADMRKPVTRWMKSAGLSVKTEFITPWGICDLVGSNARRRSITTRLSLGQTRHISSLTRVAVFLSIPELGSDETSSVEKLSRTFRNVLPKETVISEVEKLVIDGFVCSVGRGRLQKLNGWVPLHRRLVAVELKLKRVEEAMWQACTNLNFAEESYVALPHALAVQVNENSNRWKEFFDYGVGLLAVKTTSCSLIKKSQHTTIPDPILQFYCVEKFWRSFIKDN
jgi:hypothetical protein